MVLPTLVVTVRRGFPSVDALLGISFRTMATVLSADLESFPYNSEINNDLGQESWTTQMICLCSEHLRKKKHFSLRWWIYSIMCDCLKSNRHFHNTMAMKQGSLHNVEVSHTQWWAWHHSSASTVWQTSAQRLRWLCAVCDRCGGSVVIIHDRFSWVVTELHTFTFTLAVSSITMFTFMNILYVFKICSNARMCGERDFGSKDMGCWVKSWTTEMQNPFLLLAWGFSQRPQTFQKNRFVIMKTQKSKNLTILNHLK